MHPVYFSHPYARNEREARLVAHFGVLLRHRGFLPKLDPPSDDVNAAKLERHLGYTSGLIAVLTQRAQGPSPYILYEIGMALRARKPVLVFVEDSLPNDIVPAQAMQRRFSPSSVAFETLENVNALDILSTYVGDRPLPRYRGPSEQRSCVLIGTKSAGRSQHEALVQFLGQRGYRVVEPTQDASREDPWSTHASVASSQLAIAVVGDSNPFAAYVVGYAKAALVPTIEFTSDITAHKPTGIPDEFLPRELADGSGSLVIEAMSQIELFEENFVELDPERADEYARMLLETGGPDRYTDGLRSQFVQEITMGDRFEVGGDAGVVAGRDSHVHDVTFVKAWDAAKSDIDIEQLARELGELRAELKASATTPEQDVAVGAVASAEVAAKAGDGPTTLERIAKAGKWALGVAEKIGASVAVAAIKATLGI